MHRIDGPGATPDNRFTEGDPVAAVPATEVSAAWLNSVQEELVAIVLEAGLSLDKGDDSQVLQAIRSLIGNADDQLMQAASALIDDRIAQNNNQLMQAVQSLIDNAVESVAIVSGAKMLFLNSSAPTGWTQDTSINDRVLRVVNSSGGGQGGSWTISGLSASVTVNNTTLSSSQMPNHRHAAGKAEYYTDVAYGSTSGGNQQQSSGGLATANEYPYTNSVGGGGAHNHSATASISSNGNWRPSYVNVIACTKV